MKRMLVILGLFVLGVLLALGLLSGWQMVSSKIGNTRLVFDATPTVQSSTPTVQPTPTQTQQPSPTPTVKLSPTPTAGSKTTLVISNTHFDLKKDCGLSLDPDWFCRVKIANVGSSRVSWKWDSTNKKDIIIAF